MRPYKTLWFGTAILISAFCGSAMADDSSWSQTYSTKKPESSVVWVKPPIAPTAPTAAAPNSVPGAVPPPPGPSSRSMPHNAPRPATALRAAPRGGASADGAWARQLGPFQKMTGVTPGQAKGFVQDVKQRYIQGSRETMSSAQDWALILGQSGLIGAVGETSAEWFKYVSTDLPGAIMTNDPGVGNNLMGGLNGFGAYPGYGLGGAETDEAQ